ncbi:MAG: ribonuclease III [Alphaproteobacteria bacterium]|nr:ribonuclease III [Alphaproteobacteria bacterium]|tara:strand:+ start:4972 stop:5685 length:714 start_codon:yes stop_codon:yes gene_type:complete
MSSSHEDLYRKLRYEFDRSELLDEALTHPSAVKGGRRAVTSGGDYERLEFLGDRVLGLVVAHDLLARFEDADAGQLARRYNALVRRETLADVAREIDLGRHLVLARSERGAGGANKPAILANACEALIGALFMDGGLEPAARFIHHYWDAKADALVRAPKDSKTELQEWAHSVGKEPPNYVLVDQEGAAHNPVFTMRAEVDGYAPAEGSGTSKRVAEQAAAAAFLAQVSGSRSANEG